MAMESKSFAEFLVEVPPYTEIHIAEFRDPPPHCQVLLPKINVEKRVKSPRVFQPRDNKYARVDGTMDLFLSYVCENCGKQLKHFSIVAARNERSRYETQELHLRIHSSSEEECLELCSKTSVWF